MGIFAKTGHADFLRGFLLPLCDPVHEMDHHRQEILTSMLYLLSSYGILTFYKNKNLIF